jgi:hypothetical protein
MAPRRRRLGDSVGPGEFQPSNLANASNTVSSPDKDEWIARLEKRNERPESAFLAQGIQRGGDGQQPQQGPVCRTHLLSVLPGSCKPFWLD